MTTRIYWEQLAAGCHYDFGDYPVTAAEIMAFGRSYDPLPHHTDPLLAAASPLGVLCASGIHALGMAQKLLCDNLFNHSALIAGSGVSDMRMHQPIVPGDCLRVRLAVVTATAHKYKPDRGWVDFETTLYRQDQAAVMTFKTSILFLKSPVD